MFFGAISPWFASSSTLFFLIFVMYLSISVKNEVTIVPWTIVEVMMYM